MRARNFIWVRSIGKSVNKLYTFKEKFPYRSLYLIHMHAFLKIEHHVSRKTSEGITLFTVYFKSTYQKHFRETQTKLVTIEFKIRKLILLRIFDEYFPDSSLTQGNPRQISISFPSYFKKSTILSQEFCRQVDFAGYRLKM